MTKTFCDRCEIELPRQRPDPEFSVDIRQIVHVSTDGNKAKLNGSWLCCEKCVRALYGFMKVGEESPDAHLRSAALELMEALKGLKVAYCQFDEVDSDDKNVALAEKAIANAEGKLCT